jgi:hypothetical protein
MKFRLTLILLFMACGACSRQTAAPDAKLSEAAKPTNPKLFLNGKVYTVNEQQAWAEAVYVENGVIKFVGGLEEAQKTLRAGRFSLCAGGRRASFREFHRGLGRLGYLLRAGRRGKQ